MYGLIEQTVDEILIQTAHTYNTLHTKYDDLPARIREEFWRLGLQTLVDPERARLRQQIDFDDVLATLNVRSDEQARRLVPAVFTRKQSNYRHAFVCELLGRLDISLGDDKGLVDSDLLDRVGHSTVSNFLLELVGRRNELAHAYAFSDEILGFAGLEDYLAVVENYLLSIELLANTRLVNEAINMGAVSAVGRVAHQWSQSLGIDLLSAELAEQSEVVFKKPSGGLFCGVVSSLVVDSVKTLSVRVPENQDKVEVGVQLDSNAWPRLERAEVFVLPSELGDLYFAD